MGINNASIDDYKLFSHQKDHPYRSQGLMVIESGRLVYRALKLPSVKILKILCPKAYYDQYHELINSSEADIVLAEESKTQTITGFRLHQGVMALARRPKDTCLKQFGKTVVALNGVNNAENVGAIVRNCLAFGATDLLVGPTSCSPFVRRSIRVSMGSVFKCRIRHSENIERDLETLKCHSYQIIAAHISHHSTPIHQLDLAPKSCLIIGCEGTGIEPKVVQLADHSAHIPINPEVDSLNASVASGIALYQLNLARREHKS